MYPPALPPKRLLKADTQLPANIVDVVYSLSFEWGKMRYIAVQNDTADEVHDDDTFWIFFNEKAEGIFGDDFSDAKLTPDALHAMRAFVRSSFSDEKSQLHQIMNAREIEWEAHANAYKEKREKQYHQN